MKMTNAQMYDSIPVLQQAKDETGMLGYAIAVNLRRLSTEVEEYARKRDLLLRSYGTAVEGSAGRYTLTAEDAAAFQRELEPYAKIETEMAVMQVTPEIFTGGSLTAGQMYALSWMVKED